MKLFTFITIAFLFLSVIVKGQQVGDQAPDFTLQELQGGNFSLSSETGKVVFIFWLGYACPFCQSATPSINSEIINIFKNRSGFVAIGIDTWDGSSTQVQSFQSQTGLDVKYLIKGSSVAQNWSTTYDRLAVVGKNGKIVFKGTQGASSDIGNAKTAIEAALQVATAVTSLEDNDSRFVNYPNPFKTQTTIRFQLDQPALVALDVYDITGKKVRALTKERYPAGKHTIVFSKGQLDNGIYFLRLNQNGQFLTRKVIVR